jgi:hypothetical protein
MQTVLELLVVIIQIQQQEIIHIRVMGMDQTLVVQVLFINVQQIIIHQMDQIV